MAELVSIKRNVDVSPGQAAPAVFHCSQGDVGSKIILGLVNNGTAYAIPSGVTVTIEGSESNGSIFTPISATASGSDITFYLTGEMTAVAGPAICQAVLKSGSNILGTANFTLEVESSPMGADAPPVFTDAGWTWMLNKLTTEFVPALGDNIIDAIDSKLDKNQGTANAGKYLKVGADGNVTAEELDVTTDKTLSIADKAADAKAVGDELDDLKADLSDAMNLSKRNLLLGISFEKGSVTSTGDLVANNRIRSGFVNLDGVKTLDISVANGYKYVIYFYSENETNVPVDSTVAGTLYTLIFNTWKTNRCYIPIHPNIKYAKILIADTSDSTSISVSDKDKVFVFGEYPLYTKEKHDELRGSIISNADGHKVNYDEWCNGVPAVLSNLIAGSSSRIISPIIDISDIKGSFKIETVTGYKAGYYIYDEQFNQLKSVYWNTVYEVMLKDTYKYLIIALSTTNDDNIDPSAGADNVSITFIPTSDSEKYQQLSDITNNGFVNIKWELGTLNPGTGTENNSVTARLRSEYILVGKGTKIICGSNYKHLFYTFDRDKVYESDVSWTTNDLVIDHDCYIRIIIAKPNDATISSSEINTIAESESIYRAIPQVVVNTNNEDSTIPSYFEGQLETAIETAQNNIFDAGIDGDSFVFITDLHWQSNSKISPALVKKVIDHTNVGKIICGGDLIGGGAKSQMISLMSDCVDSFKGISRFYALFGNHDSNTIGSTTEDRFTKGETYAILQKESDFVMNYGEPCYFAFDNPTTKTRYICLDTGIEGTTLDTTQEDWIDSTLASMPVGYHALVFAHIIYGPVSNWYVGLKASDLQMTSFMSSVCNILDTFNADNNDKKVEAIFGGHVHIDCDFSTTGGIPIVLTDCDARQTFSETSEGSGESNHALNTVNEQCFDVITIDYTNQLIKCVRIGRGNNRTISY